MVECSHKVLVLLPGKEAKQRCLHCHLTISEEELGRGYCPECYEERGVRHSDFEMVEEERDERVTYRCEDCNLLIECSP